MAWTQLQSKTLAISDDIVSVKLHSHKSWTSWEWKVWTVSWSASWRPVQVPPNDPHVSAVLSSEDQLRKWVSSPSALWSGNTSYHLLSARLSSGNLTQPSLSWAQGFYFSSYQWKTVLSLPPPPTLHPSFRLLKEKIGFLCQPCVPQGSGWTWRLFPKSRGYQSVGWKVDAGVWPKQQEVSHCGLTRLSPGSAFAAACSGSEAAAHGANYSTSKHLMSDCCNLHQNEGWLLELPHRRVPHTVCLHWGSLTLLEIHYLWWLTCRALKH